MTYRARPLAFALTSLAAAGLAACSSAAPHAASAAQARAAGATVTAEAACKALALWEANPGDGDLAGNTALRETFKDTTRPLSADFAAWASAIRDSSPSVGSDADKVTADCLDGHGDPARMPSGKGVSATHRF